jgi:hypothetical protein
LVQAGRSPGELGREVEASACRRPGAVPVTDTIPVCLAEGRVYNVEDSLWVGAADKARLLRCLDERKRAEDWPLLRHQLAGAGRFLAKLPGRLMGRCAPEPD